ncbi:uncharacterized protein LOC135848740 [Planococcus citri]|uniref:uncharacterized protein LOC135848740 n=1 Tax=Planococcus citri TaxID=170843 RepID=UPI0031F9129C
MSESMRAATEGTTATDDSDTDDTISSSDIFDSDSDYELFDALPCPPLPVLNALIEDDDEVECEQLMTGIVTHIAKLIEPLRNESETETQESNGDEDDLDSVNDDETSSISSSASSQSPVTKEMEDLTDRLQSIVNDYGERHKENQKFREQLLEVWKKKSSELATMRSEYLEVQREKLNMKRMRLDLKIEKQELKRRKLADASTSSSAI